VTNVEILRRFYEALNSDWARIIAGDDPETMLTWSIWDPDLVIEEIAEFPDAARYDGYDGLRAWIRNWRELFDELRIDAQGFIPAGDHVVVPTHQSFRSKEGVEVEQEIVHVWKFRAGRAVYATGYRDLVRALESVGLTEEAARDRVVDP
jgi:ketosteroid isomerase-like protein